MLKKLNNFLSGTGMTMVSAFFLILGFALPRMSVHLPIDPAWLTVFISGIPLVYLALWRVIHNPGISKISSALLIVIAMFAAIIIGDLFAAGEVAFIMAVGAILEDRTTQRATKGLQKLMTLTPSKARKITDGREITISASEIKPGDILRVVPGETIPADGTILTGETSVDQSVLTGESLPVDKEAGDSVYCGSINRFGAIDIKAVKTGEDSSLKTLIRMVQEAENKQAPMQRIADKCASWLVPVALCIAIAAFFITRDIVRSVTVLVVFCPCALVLATPTAVMAAIGQAAKKGVIIKSGEALEKMSKVDMLTFDKTGTLTCGHLTISDLFPLTPEISPDQLIALAAAVEQKSEHPLAKAIVSYAHEHHIPVLPCTAFKMAAGKGVFSVIANTSYYCGNLKYLNAHHIHPGEAATSQLKKFCMQGKACVILADSHNCLGIIALSDTLRTNAPDVISKLNDLRTRSVLLTGDNQQSASYFAQKAGITEIHASLLPAEKVSSITALQKKDHTVCMVGDGINDAPALKTADVGIAMGSMGSDLSVEACDIALMDDDLSKIPYLKRLASATVNTIKLSITLSMCINFIAIVLSVRGLLTPTTGALVHNAGSCFVILIAALLYDRKFD